MTKDQTYAMEEALRHGVALRTGAAGLEAYRDAVAKGWGEKDIAAVVEPYREGRAER